MYKPKIFPLSPQACLPPVFFPVVYSAGAFYYLSKYVMKEIELGIFLLHSLYTQSDLFSLCVSSSIILEF
jgi:hypothetical protein